MYRLSWLVVYEFPASWLSYGAFLIFLARLIIARSDFEKQFQEKSEMAPANTWCMKKDTGTCSKLHILGIKRFAEAQYIIEY